MKQRDPNDASRKLLITKPLKKINFRILTLAFVQSQSKLLAYICKLIVCLRFFAWGIAASFCEAIAKQKIQRIADGFSDTPLFWKRSKWHYWNWYLERMKKIRNFALLRILITVKATSWPFAWCYKLLLRTSEAQLLDNMDLERERGITIKSHAIQMEYYKGRIYLEQLILQDMLISHMKFHDLLRLVKVRYWLLMLHKVFKRKQYRTYI
jgi:hypothetical protein